MKITYSIIGLIAVLASFFYLRRQPSVDYSRDIKPILNQRCISCHGGVKKKGGFSLLFKEEAFAPTESGKPAIIPGDAANSEFYKRLITHDVDERMPYKEAPLPEAEIELLKKWINEGAPWGEHWAFQPLTAVSAPKSFGLAGLFDWFSDDWGNNEIDAFVEQKLEENDLEHSPEADKRQLARRVALDLTGVPPSEKLLNEFLNNDAENAYEIYVDSLLASPRYGERWAGMWLELARFSDSKGYEKDERRSIWRYRDYVIDAFNQDMPYDRFLTEQLAGDLLPNPTDEQLIATAFHRNTMNNDEGGTEDEEFRSAAVVDRVNTTWEALQGTTFSCVQCHSHPYDPIRHEDYFRYMAFFNNTRDEDTPDDSPVLREFSTEDAQKLTDLKRWINAHSSEKQAKEIDYLVRFQEPRINPHWGSSFVNGSLADGKYLGIRNGGSVVFKDLPVKGKPKLIIAYGHKFPKPTTMTIRRGSAEGAVLKTITLQAVESGGWTNNWHVIEEAIPVSENPTETWHLTFRNPSAKPDQSTCLIGYFILTNDLPAAEGRPEKARELVELLNAKPETITPILLENPTDYFRPTYVWERGVWTNHTEKVMPGTPEILGSLPADFPQNRLGLARWMTSPQHPLTARVAVNRFWEQLFGYGLVETLEDFGSQGFAPSHPELLDYLALKFANDYQWHPKKLLKYIVMSATYRQDSRVTEKQAEQDPQNRWLARGPRVRLAAEQIRDQALAVSGLLSEKQYGPSVMPPQPDGLWRNPYSGMKWQTSEGDDRHRRSLYTFMRRTSPYPAMTTFDASSREVCQVRRIRTNTPLQALVTLNDPVYVECAVQLAKNTAAKSPEKHIENMYTQAIHRPLDAKRKQILLQLYNNARQELDTCKTCSAELMAFVGDSTETRKPIAAMAVVANTIMNLDEFVMKE